MVSDTPRGPNQKITKEEVREAVIAICEERKAPVVRSEDIAELEWVSVGRQAINNHLNTLEEENEISSLSVGRGAVWWVSESDFEADEVAVTSIDWENMDPAEIPDDLVKQRPEVDDPTYWESMMENWATVAGGVSFIFLFGLIVLVMDEFFNIDPGIELQTLGAVSILGGLLVIFIALGLIGIARGGQFLDDIGVFDSIRGWYGKTRNSLFRRISKWVQSKIDDE